MTEVFLCTARRTPTGRWGGALAIVRPDDKAALVVGGLPDLPPDLSEDEAGEGNRNVARRAVLPPRLGPQGPALAVNRLCAGGPDAAILGALCTGIGQGVALAMHAA